MFSDGNTALTKWELPCDMYTFFIVLYNFAIVGVLAIFYQKVMVIIFFAYFSPALMNLSFLSVLIVFGITGNPHHSHTGLPGVY
jgi:hypothetical protein